jgi:hypothetical protein
MYSILVQTLDMGCPWTWTPRVKPPFSCRSAPAGSMGQGTQGCSADQNACFVLACVNTWLLCDKMSCFSQLV